MPEKHGRKQAKLTPEMVARQWQKGQSGNPKGRPKKEDCYPDLIRKYSYSPLPPKLLLAIERIYPNAGNVGHKEALVLLAYIYAFKGEKWAFDFIVERDEGKIKDAEQTQTIDLKEFAEVIANNYEPEAT